MVAEESPDLTGLMVVIHGESGFEIVLVAFTNPTTPVL
jgi:hypothetical protein